MKKTVELLARVEVDARRFEAQLERVRRHLSGGVKVTDLRSGTVHARRGLPTARGIQSGVVRGAHR